MLAIDEDGYTVDGDVILAIIAQDMLKKNQLKDNTLVVTVMSNLGLDFWAEKAGVSLIKTKVGDRYVLEDMLKFGYNLGGEQSGHVILLDHSTTGDGILCALRLLRAERSGFPAKLCASYHDGSPASSAQCACCERQQESDYGR